MRGGFRGTQELVRLSDPSHVGEARRAAARLASTTGFEDVPAGRLAIVATELAGNIVRHTRGGELLLQALNLASGPAIEVLALDSGPGMRNVARCLQDGYSTIGTQGTGLGAVQRQSDEFDIYSVAETGTVVMARVSASPSRGEITQPLRFGVISVPVRGETACGDTWRLFWSDENLSVMVADGLGHGSAAAEAANRAAALFEEDPFGEPAVFLHKAHERLTGSRGGAVGLGLLERGCGALRYAGVGNISGKLLASSGSRGLASHNGTVGSAVHKVQEFEYPWTADTILVMHSDGLSTRWEIGRFFGLQGRHPAVIAGVLYRDFRRKADDTTILVVSFDGKE